MAVSCFGCCTMMVVSSAYVIVSVLGCVGVAMSCVKRLKSVGDKTELYATPFLKCRVCEDLPLYVVCACLLERKLASHFFQFLWMCVFCLLKYVVELCRKSY